MDDNGNRKIHEWRGLCWHEWDKRQKPEDRRCVQFVCGSCGGTAGCCWPNPIYDSDPAACMELIQAVRVRGYSVELWGGHVDEPYLMTIYGPQDDDVFRGKDAKAPAAVSAAVLKLIDSESEAKNG